MFDFQLFANNVNGSQNGTSSTIASWTWCELIPFALCSLLCKNLKEFKTKDNAQDSSTEVIALFCLCSNLIDSVLFCSKTSTFEPTYSSQGHICTLYSEIVICMFCVINRYSVGDGWNYPSTLPQQRNGSVLWPAINMISLLPNRFVAKQGPLTGLGLVPWYLRTTRQVVRAANETREVQCPSPVDCLRTPLIVLQCFSQNLDTIPCRTLEGLAECMSSFRPGLETGRR